VSLREGRITPNALHDESDDTLDGPCVDTQPLIAIVATQSIIHFFIVQLAYLFSNLEGYLGCLGRPQEFFLNLSPLALCNEAALLHVGQELPRYLQK
jgi:hypothetical protein